MRNPSEAIPVLLTSRRRNQSESGWIFTPRQSRGDEDDERRARSAVGVEGRIDLHGGRVARSAGRAGWRSLTIVGEGTSGLRDRLNSVGTRDTITQAQGDKGKLPYGSSALCSVKSWCLCK